MHPTLTWDRTGTIGDAYGVRSIPHLFIIDREGRVAHGHKGHGPNTIHEIVDEPNALLQSR